MEITTDKYTVKINYRTGEITVKNIITGEFLNFPWDQLTADFLSSAESKESVDVIIETRLIRK